VADRIAGEAGERRHPIRHVRTADRAQREQIVEREREIAAGDAGGGQRDIAPVGRYQGFEDLGAVDRAQDAIKRHHSDHDDGDAEHDADPVPADLFVAKHRCSMQRIEHAPFAISLLGLHRSIRHAFPGSPGILPHIVVATPDFQSSLQREQAFRADGRQRLAKLAQPREGLPCDRYARSGRKPPIEALPPSAAMIVGDRLRSAKITVELPVMHWLRKGRALPTPVK